MNQSREHRIAAATSRRLLRRTFLGVALIAPLVYLLVTGSRKIPEAIEDSNLKAGAEHAERDRLSPATNVAPPLDQGITENEPEELDELGSQLDDGELRKAAIDKVRRTLALYEESMVFPPWSRPADGSTKHLLDWNKPWPTGQPFAADADGHEIRADVTLDKLFAAPGEPMNVELTIHRVNDGASVLVEELQSRVEWYDGENWQVADDVPLVRRNNQLVGTFVPSRLEPLASAPLEARFMVFARIGEFAKKLVVPFQYAAEPSFEVIGVADDRIVDGSLEIILKANVYHAAPTLIQAGLFDATGTKAIAIYDDYFRPTITGQQMVPIRFFGKIIHERRIDGPYQIRALHGHVRVPEADPPEVFWSRADEPAILTHHYSYSQFSALPWSSTEKDAKRSQYLDLMRDLASAK